MSLAVGDRVQPLDGQSTGTLERVRTSKQGYLVAEVLWDTGARCAEPLSWLGRLEDVQAAERARQSAERKERRKHLADYQPRRCEGCAKVFNRGTSARGSTRHGVAVRHGLGWTNRKRYEDTPADKIGSRLGTK